MSQLKIWDESKNTWVGIPAGGVGVPSGGSSGQFLKKSSSTDYATEWAEYKKSTPTYSTYTDISSSFPSSPTSASTNTYTVPNDGWVYLFADSTGWTLYISIDGTDRFIIPAYVNPTAVTFVLPVTSGQIIRLYTNNSATSWHIRQVLFFT